MFFSRLFASPLERCKLQSLHFGKTPRALPILNNFVAQPKFLTKPDVKLQAVGGGFTTMLFPRLREGHTGDILWPTTYNVSGNIMAVISAPVACVHVCDCWSTPRGIWEICCCEAKITSQQHSRLDFTAFWQ